MPIPASAYFRVFVRREGQTSDDDSTAVVICKVETLAHLATTHGKEHRPIRFRVIDLTIRCGQI